MNGAMLSIAFPEPAGFLVGLLAVPIVLLFLLKRKRRDVRLSSTMLWERALRDTLARSPFRRPSEWLSLLLLLLVIASLMFAAAGTRLFGARTTARHVVIVLDTTASMATREGDQTRFEQAVDRARSFVANLEDGTRCTILAAGIAPRAVARESDDRGFLQHALTNVAVQPVEGDLALACESACRAAARSTAPGDVFVFSDFVGVDRTALEGIETAGVPVTWLTCGSARSNVGITQLSVASNEGRRTLLVGLAANEVSAAMRRVTLSEGDRLLDAMDVRLAAGERHAVTFALPTQETIGPERFIVRLEPGDELTLDDEAYVSVSTRGEPRVLLVGEQDAFLARLPNVFPDVVFESVGSDELAAFAHEGHEPIDLAIVSEALPDDATVEADVSLYLGCLPRDDVVTADGELLQPLLVDWDRSHASLRDLGLENLLVMRSLRLRPANDARVLVRTDGGPQLVQREREGRSVFVWASPLDASNFVLLPAFPILLRNLLLEPLSRIRVGAQEASRPLQERAGLDRLRGTVDVTMISPSGEVQTGRYFAHEEVRFDGAPELGFHTLRVQSSESGATLEHAIGVNLFSLAETSAAASAPDPKAFAGGGVSVRELANWSTERPIWEWLVLLALVALVVEGFVWLRRTA